MASTVQTGGGSGVDLSGLTSGERLLIGLLSQKIPFTKNLSIGAQGWNSGTIDFTEVKNITFAETEANTPCQILVQSPTASVSSVNIQPLSTATLDVSSYGENTRMDIAIPQTSSYSTATVQVTAFTTTDGKVHTASNLNY